MRQKLFIIFIMLSFSYFAQISEENNSVISEETQYCIDCHYTVTPGIVADWENSRHSKISMKKALQKEKLGRRVSVNEIPSEVKGEVLIGCYECHSLNEKLHTDNFDHFGYNINVIPSPNDCKTCHPVEVEEYSMSKKAHAIGNLKNNPTYHSLVKTIIGKSEFDGKMVKTFEPTSLTEGETCFACHGTKVEVVGKRIVDSELGEIELPELSNWPNQGVGRENPDGSLGSCTACHPRHSFSIEVARQPYTCGQCHLEPDVPSYNIYKESKHGNLFSSLGKNYNFEAIPWQAGKDFQAPTCATCHNSLLVGSEGEVIVERSHNFGSRLWERLFGLPYSHRQPKSGKTYEIVNADGLNLPTTFSGLPATHFLIDEGEALIRQEKMQSVCTSCHGTRWAENQLKKIERTNNEVDELVNTGTKLLQKAWELGIADKSNPFDEEIEIQWMNMWLFYGNSIRYATAMMGPDYSTFKNGWYRMKETIQKMKNTIDKN